MSNRDQCRQPPRIDIPFPLHSEEPRLPTQFAQSQLYSWQGPHATSLAPDSNIRIGFVNVRGLSTKKYSLEDSIQELVHSMATFDLQYLGISEHQLSLATHDTKRRLRDCVLRAGSSAPGSVVHQFNSSAEIPPQGTHKLMGGTGILVSQSLVGRIEPKGRGGDSMGRWSYVNLRRSRNQSPITIVSIYQVCQTPTNVLGTTAWHQQRRALDLSGRSNIHPRDAFVTDLLKFLQELQQAGHAIIVGGDWNDSFSSSRSALYRISTHLDLVDPWATTYPNHPEFPTYERGSKRIDSILMSRALLPAVHSISYTPVGLLCNTDHRGVILELNTRQLFGDDRDRLPNVTHRGVRICDKQSVQKYIEVMYAHLLAQNAFERAKTLERPSLSDSNLVLSLDSLLGEAGDIGDKKCFRRRPQWFSVSIHKKRLELSYFRHYYNGLKCGLDRSQVVKSKLSLAQLPNDIPQTITEVSQRVIQLETELRQLEVKSGAIRSTFLLDTSVSHQEQHQRTRAHILRKINRHEQAKTTWTQLSFMTSQTQQTLDRIEVPQSWPSANTPITSLDQLEDPKMATEWKTITEPQDVEQYLLMRNRIHFGQAQGTPFTVSPLSDDFDWGATTEKAESLLNGQYIPPNEIPPLWSSVLRFCQKVVALDTLPALLTMDAFEGKIKRWNERTTTSPSGRHLGRYKALFAKGTAPPDNSNNEYEVFKSKQLQIANLILSIINFCITTGFVLPRWTNVVNVMIPKDLHEYKIHRLRVIHIYEADFNLILAVKWRELLQFADRQGIVHQGQYGGRPGREATSVALLEELRLDVSYCTRRTLITFDNDAASCYDRIIPALASLINRKYGMHRQVVLLHGKTLQEVKYKLKTALGVSDDAYSHSIHFPIYGTGQGSGNSPMVWLFLSATLFDAHNEIAHGATFQDPTGTISTHMTLSGFVDDTNTALNDWLPQHQANLTELLHLIQQDAQYWNDLLFISGGKLELSKCSFHVLRFDFQSDGTPRPSRDLPPPLILQDAVSGAPIEVSALPIDTPHKILGHWKAPAGSGAKQLKHLSTKAVSVSTLIYTGPFSRHGAKLVYRAKYVSFLSFVLPQCTFTPTQLKKAERVSMPRIIAKCGFFRKTSYALLFAPTDYAGGGFLHWSTIQGEGQIRQFIKHWRTSTEVSAMLRISLAWSQWQAGISTSILQDLETPLHHVEARWIPSLRGALHRFSCTVRLDQTYVPLPERKNDAFIMDVALQSGLFDTKALRTINYCRLYLHVTTISELFQCDGSTLLPHMYECTRPPWFDPSLITVLQKRPSKYQCKMRWQKLCEVIKSRQIQLGEWHRRKQRLRRETYVIPGSRSTIYHWYHGQYWICALRDDTRKQYEMVESSDWTPTASAMPIDVKARVIRHLYLPAIQIPSRWPRTTCQPLATTFDEYIFTLPDWEQSLLKHINWHGNTPMTLMAEWFSSSADPIYVTSDGSSHERLTMSFGVVVGNDTGTIYATLMGPAFGTPTSHRSESTGCLAGALFLFRVTTFTGQSISPLVPVTTFSDNSSMINSLSARKTYEQVYPNATLVPDWDLLEEIHRVYQHLNLQQHTYKWVRGHQDTTTPKQSRSVEANYNIIADQLASTYTSQHNTESRPSTPMMTTTACILDTPTGSLHGKYAVTLRRLAAEPIFFQYLSKRHGWDFDIPNMIDWDAFRVAARNYVSTDVHLLKLVHDLLPTRHHVSKFQPWTDPSCHYCTEHETIDHIQLSQCNSISQQFQHDLTDAVRHYFQRNHAPDAFQQVFFSALLRWFNPVTASDPAVPDEHISHLFLSQSTIGWRFMTRGFLSIKWRELYQKSLLENQWGVHDSSTSQDPDENDDNCEDSDNDLGELDIESISTDHESTPNLMLLGDNTSASHKTSDPIIFMAGLIKTMWLELGTLWKHHLQKIHQSQEASTSPVQLADLKAKVRVLHQQRPKVLATHRDRYFHDDLERFLENATLRQLQSYIAHYQPAILSSIRSASMSQFDPTNSDPVTNLTTHEHLTQHPALEEASHRKRNRLRILGRVVQWIIRLARR